ncbi:MAG: hypothetical protein GX587_11645 [Bacteroidales bacterium]|nr:hypothetical protein [Bacteroidales bacterium]
MLFVFSVSTILYIGVIRYMSISSWNSASDNAQKDAILPARELAASMTKDFALVLTFTQTYSVWLDFQFK